MANVQFKYYYQNEQGVNTKTMDIYLKILNSDIDFIIFTETWIGNNIFD